MKTRFTSTWVAAGMLALLPATLPAQPCAGIAGCPNAVSACAAESAAVVYQAAVAYLAPVVYQMPVVYYGPVFYAYATACQSSPAPPAAELSTVTVIARHGGSYTYANYAHTYAPTYANYGEPCVSYRPTVIRFGRAGGWYGR